MVHPHSSGLPRRQIRKSELQELLALTGPHIPEMIEVLVRLARTARTPTLRERAASRIIELHLLANSQAAEQEKTAGRMLVVAASQLDAVEAAHRKVLNAEPTYVPTP